MAWIKLSCPDNISVYVNSDLVEFVAPPVPNTMNPLVQTVIYTGGAYRGVLEDVEEVVAALERETRLQQQLVARMQIWPGSSSSSGP